MTVFFLELLSLAAPARFGEFELVGGLRSLGLFSGHGESLIWGAYALGQRSFDTIARTCLVFLLSVPAGTLLGTLIALSGLRIRHGITAVRLAAAIPIVCLIPMAVSVLGDSGIAIFSFLAAALAVIVTTEAFGAASSIERRYWEQAQLLGMHWLRRTIVFYLPAVNSAMRVSYAFIFGQLWGMSLAAESISADTGLGSMVGQAYRNSNFNQLWTLTLVYGLLGLMAVSMSEFLLPGRRRDVPVSIAP